jgi:molecular chaperone GrpE
MRLFSREFMRSESGEGEGKKAAEEERSYGDVTEAQTGGVVEEFAPGWEEAAPSADEAVSREDFDAVQERYLRLAAEYENFRKRTERERMEQRDRAQGQLVGKLLEALDDLERLTRFTAEGTTVDSVLEGVKLVERKFARALESAGLEQVSAQGERFDPEQHEALMLTETDDPAEDEMVGDVFQTGYRFRGMLLRPARVQVKRLEG